MSIHKHIQTHPHINCNSLLRKARYTSTLWEPATRPGPTGSTAGFREQWTHAEACSYHQHSCTDGGHYILVLI